MAVAGKPRWRELHTHAGLDYRLMHNRPVIPDSNDRVQAVIDGQGIALWDALVQNELDSGELFYLSEVTLDKKVSCQRIKDTSMGSVSIANWR